jgi:hypothetical protein
MQSEQSLFCLGKEYLFKTEKVFSLKNSAPSITASISIRNASFSAFSGEMATELCFGYRNDPRGQSLKIEGKRVRLASGGNFFENAKEADFKDRYLRIGASLRTNKSAGILCVPILGIGAVAAPSLSHGLRIVMFIKTELKGQETETFHLSIRLNDGGFFS